SIPFGSKSFAGADWFVGEAKPAGVTRRNGKGLTDEGGTICPSKPSGDPRHLPMQVHSCNFRLMETVSPERKIGVTNDRIQECCETLSAG
ncbi:MAG: hypothetical protein IJS44_02675, partial [Clostridia bacterium]|nr:hypothetical protein [Clostridia bacterium]